METDKNRLKECLTSLRSSWDDKFHVLCVEIWLMFISNYSLLRLTSFDSRFLKNYPTAFPLICLWLICFYYDWYHNDFVGQWWPKVWCTDRQDKSQQGKWKSSTCTSFITTTKVPFSKALNPNCSSWAVRELTGQTVGPWTRCCWKGTIAMNVRQRPTDLLCTDNSMEPVKTILAPNVEHSSHCQRIWER